MPKFKNRAPASVRDMDDSAEDIVCKIDFARIQQGQSNQGLADRIRVSFFIPEENRWTEVKKLADHDVAEGIKNQIRQGVVALYDETVSDLGYT